MKTLTKRKSFSDFYKPPKHFFISNPLDMPFLILVMLLLTAGLVMMFSASYAVAYYQQDGPLYFIKRQAIFAVLGLFVMYFTSRCNYHKLQLLSKPIMVLSVILMILVLTPLGVNINGAQRWLNLYFTTLQPSEIVKFAVILTFSKMLVNMSDARIRTYKYGVFPFMCIIGVFVVLLKFQPHLSATIIIAATGLVLIFIAGAKFWGLLGLAAAGGGLVVLYILNNSYAMQRISVWLDPFIDPKDTGWQGVQSFLAIGSGGIWGLGLGQSRQKHLYLPEPANDFIFSVLCEELGFIGATAVVIGFAALIIRGYWIAMHAPDKFGCLLAAGITTQVAIQAIVNMCVVSGLMPITGAALPFFSYGGTSLLILLFEIGVVLSVSRQIPISKQG